MDEIARGTTPTIEFDFGEEIDVTDLTVADFSIQQAGVAKIEKALSAATVSAEHHLVSWKLTQTESLNLDTGKAQIFCDWKLDDGTRGVNEEYFVKVIKSGKNEAI